MRHDRVRLWYTPGVGSHPQSEVKGLWLVTARSWVDREHEPGAWTRVVRAVPEPHRAMIEEPLAGSWYPEEALQAAFAAMRVQLAEDDDEAFMRIIEACTHLGISRFFRVLLRATTPRFVLKQVPTMWRQIRRGPAKVVVDAADDETMIAYSGFPYFDDPNYVLVTLATLRELVRTSTKREPEVRVFEHSDSALTVVVRLAT